MDGLYKPRKLSVLEISAATTGGGSASEISVRRDFPEFDICSDVLAERFDLIIAEHVFEHIRWPYRAGGERPADARGQEGIS